MKLLLALALSIAAYGQLTVNDPYALPTAYKPVVASVTVSGGVTAITVNAGTLCNVAPEVIIMPLTGTGSGAVYTATCSGGLVSTSLNQVAVGSGYTAGQVGVFFNRALWVRLQDHVHPGAPFIPCALSCLYACSNHKVVSPIWKTSDTLYINPDPGAACTVVGGASCPVYSATTWTLHSVTVGTPTRLVINDPTGTLTAALSVVTATPTPILVAGSTGVSVSGAAAIIGDLTVLNNKPDVPWYAKVISTSAGVSITVDLYQNETRNASSPGVPIYTTGVTSTGSLSNPDVPTVALNGCNSANPGTGGFTSLYIPGVEDVQNDSTTPVMNNIPHHISGLNVLGSGVQMSTSTTRYAAAVYMLTHPATADGASITLAHSHFQTSPWFYPQLAWMAPLAKLYPGQVLMQVIDGQNYNSDLYWDFILSLVDGVDVWGDASDDSYTYTALNNAETWINVDTVTTAEVMASRKSGRMYLQSGTLHNAARCGMTGLVLTCGNFTTEPPGAGKTNISIQFIGEGGRVIASNAGSTWTLSYTITGKEGRYVRVAMDAPTNGDAANAYNTVGRIWGGNYQYGQVGVYGYASLCGSIAACGPTGITGGRLLSEPFRIISGNLGAGSSSVAKATK